MEPVSKPDFATGLRVAGYVRGILRSAGNADLLAGAAAASTLIADTANAVAIRTAKRSHRGEFELRPFTVPYWQWIELNNRRFEELANINTAFHASPATVAPPAGTALPPESAAVSYCACTEPSLAGTRKGAAHIGDVSPPAAQPALRRIDVTTIRQVYAPAGNLVDVIV
ncbi:MAG TPA: hypothetical protein VG797_04220 [Phycisphaerales bacterium]|nr:hypothetical protein [Phycisphaerales bacterium]